MLDSDLLDSDLLDSNPLDSNPLESADLESLNAFSEWLKGMDRDVLDLCSLVDARHAPEAARRAGAESLTYLLHTLELIPDGVEELGYLEVSFAMRAFAERRAALLAQGLESEELVGSAASEGAEAESRAEPSHATEPSDLEAAASFAAEPSDVDGELGSATEPSEIEAGASGDREPSSEEPVLEAAADESAAPAEEPALEGEVAATRAASGEPDAPGEHAFERAARAEADPAESVPAESVPAESAPAEPVDPELVEAQRQAARATLERLAAGALTVREFIGDDFAGLLAGADVAARAPVRGASANDVLGDPERRAWAVAEARAWAERYAAPALELGEEEIIKLRSFFHTRALRLAS